MPLVDNPPVLSVTDAAPQAPVRILDRIADLYETDSSPQRIVPMEGLRGWAVLLVFFVHFHGAFKGFATPGSTLFYVSQFLGSVGGTGVDLFFIISGYLIYGAVVSPRFGYGRFLRRRVQRIYPTFLFVSLIYFGLWAFSGNDNFKFHGTIAEQISYAVQNLLLMPGIFPGRAMNGVAWSLSYEMFFYLLLPLLLAVTAMRSWGRMPRVYFFLGLAVAGILVSPLFEHPRVRLIAFLLGIVLFELVDRFRNRSSTWFDLAALGAYLCGLGLIYAVDKTTIVPGRLGSPVIATIAGAASFAFCGLCFHGGGILGRCFSWGPLRALGNMSYSFYLIHPLAMGTVREAIRRVGDPGQNSLVFAGLMLAGFAASWVAATLLFVAIEKPLSIHVKRRAGNSLPLAHRGVQTAAEKL